MEKLALASLLAVASLLLGCADSDAVTFKDGIKKINKFDQKYNSTVKSPPSNARDIDGLLSQLVGFKAANKLSKPLNGLVDFRIIFLEAEKLNAEGWQWGKGSTTDYGFGCKGYGRIKGSSKLRNASAQKGYEAVDMLEKFIEEFPKESKIAGLTQKDVLILNAMYFQIEEKASKDARIVESFCGKKGNETKEITA
ncbi:MAG: hypothetical protein AABX34_07610 [Nanoarchaeota archaeon]